MGRKFLALLVLALYLAALGLGTRVHFHPPSWGPKGAAAVVGPGSRVNPVAKAPSFFPLCASGNPQAESPFRQCSSRICLSALDDGLRDLCRFTGHSPSRSSRSIFPPFAPDLPDPLRGDVLSKGLLVKNGRCGKDSAPNCRLAAAVHEVEGKTDDSGSTLPGRLPQNVNAIASGQLAFCSDCPSCQFLSLFGEFQLRPATRWVIPRSVYVRPCHQILSAREAHLAFNIRGPPLVG